MLINKEIFTKSEKMLIFESQNGKVLELPILEGGSIIRIMFQTNLEKIENTSINSEKYIDEIIDSLLCQDLEEKYKDVDLQKLINKIQGLSTEDVFKLKAEIFTFWNSKEVYVMGEYLKDLFISYSEMR